MRFHRFFTIAALSTLFCGGTAFGGPAPVDPLVEAGPQATFDLAPFHQAMGGVVEALPDLSGPLTQFWARQWTTGDGQFSSDLQKALQTPLPAVAAPHAYEPWKGFSLNQARARLARTQKALRPILAEAQQHGLSTEQVDTVNRLLQEAHAALSPAIESEAEQDAVSLQEAAPRAADAEQAAGDPAAPSAAPVAAPGRRARAGRRSEDERRIAQARVWIENLLAADESGHLHPLYRRLEASGWDPALSVRVLRDVYARLHATNPSRRRLRPARLVKLANAVAASREGEIVAEALRRLESSREEMNALSLTAFKASRAMESADDPQAAQSEADARHGDIVRIENQLRAIRPVLLPGHEREIEGALYRAQNIEHNLRVNRIHARVLSLAQRRRELIASARRATPWRSDEIDGLLSSAEDKSGRTAALDPRAPLPSLEELHARALALREDGKSADALFRSDFERGLLARFLGLGDELSHVNMLAEVLEYILPKADQLVSRASRADDPDALITEDPDAVRALFSDLPSQPGRTGLQIAARRARELKDLHFVEGRARAISAIPSMMDTRLNPRYDLAQLGSALSSNAAFQGAMLRAALIQARENPHIERSRALIRLFEERARLSVFAIEGSALSYLLADLRAPESLWRQSEALLRAGHRNGAAALRSTHIYHRRDESYARSALDAFQGIALQAEPDVQRWALGELEALARDWPGFRGQIAEIRRAIRERLDQPTVWTQRARRWQSRFLSFRYERLGDILPATMSNMPLVFSILGVFLFGLVGLIAPAMAAGDFGWWHSHPMWGVALLAGGMLYAAFNLAAGHEILRYLWDPSALRETAGK